MNTERIKIIVLAAGYGKRMQSELPKVLVPLNSKPLVTYILDSVKKTGICDRPVVIVGQKRELVMKTLGNEYEYIIQEEQKGTGHAVMVAQKALENNAEHIMVLYGDLPFISTETIKNIIEKHLHFESKITFATTKVPDFNSWYNVFWTFGRILRDKEKIVAIREFKDANDEEKNIKEVNAGCWVFEAKWLWKNLEKINNQNAQKEYHLVDLVKIAFKNGNKIESIQIDPREAVGVNFKEELEILEKLTA